ncbi:MAG TPA: hypothetical protein VFO95_16500 [Gemmatimonadales bacterium]|nr:hypothetical protein [Gemmatimonadales bacterium]
MRSAPKPLVPPSVGSCVITPLSHKKAWQMFPAPDRKAEQLQNSPNESATPMWEMPTTCPESLTPGPHQHAVQAARQRAHVGADSVGPDGPVAVPGRDAVEARDQAAVVDAGALAQPAGFGFEDGEAVPDLGSRLRQRWIRPRGFGVGGAAGGRARQQKAKQVSHGTSPPVMDAGASNDPWLAKDLTLG